MTKSRQEWKFYAKQALRGNYSIVIAATMALNALNLVGSYMTGELFPSMSARDIVLSEIFAFILTLVLCVFSAGMYYMMLNMARGQDFSFGDLIYFFRNQPDRVIVASVVLALIGWLTGLPANIYAYTAEVNTLEEQIAYWGMYMLLFLGGLALNFILTVPFTLIYYILADEEQLSGFETVKESVRLMKGHIWQFILLELSFLPLMFLSMFTMYLLLLWLLPYMEMTAVMFYRDIRGELEEMSQRPYPPVTPVYRPYPSEEGQKRYIRRDMSSQDNASAEPSRENDTPGEGSDGQQNTLSDSRELPGDDFNSEA